MKLKHEAGSAEEQSFLNAAAKLALIPGVLNFKIVKETNPANLYTFGLVMEFNSQQDYDFYNDHAQHKSFVQNVWIPNVEIFQEIDYTKLS